MARVLFARGCRGGIAREIQQQLALAGYYTGNLDGAYGGATQSAVSRFQAENGLPVSGALDEDTWRALMLREPPALFERALQLTAAFEGHGYGVVQGNWDGAWLTWGIVGFTLKHGALREIVLGVHAADPEVVARCFGPLGAVLIEKLAAPPADRQLWADGISEGPGKFRVTEAWRAAFRAFGAQPVVQQAQQRRALTNYFQPALRTARTLGLRSELGLALCFDIHVQNGGVKAKARAAIAAATRRDKPANEKALRGIVAQAVADCAKSQFRRDVLARKSTITRGSGKVHGEFFELKNWGLGEHAAPV